MWVFFICSCFLTASLAQCSHWFWCWSVCRRWVACTFRPRSQEEDSEDEGAVQVLQVEPASFLPATARSVACWQTWRRHTSVQVSASCHVALLLGPVEGTDTTFFFLHVPDSLFELFAEFFSLSASPPWYWRLEVPSAVLVRPFVRDPLS